MENDVSECFTMITDGLKSAVKWIQGRSDLTHTCMSVGATGAAAALVPQLPSTSATFVTLSSTGIMLGTQCWVACAAGPTMFLNMERHAFGDIQARLFPKMGMVSMAMSGLAVASYLKNNSMDLGFGMLASSLVVSAMNSFIWFPVCTDYMYEMRKHQVGTDERKKAGMMFGITHAIANFTTLGSLAANLVFFYLVAAKLR